MKMSPNETEASEGIPIFLLKTRSTPDDGYEERFSGQGFGAQFSPTFVPVLEHQLQDGGLNAVRDLLERKQIGKGEAKKYGGLIFTSQRAVEAFAKLIYERKAVDEAWPHLQDVPIYTVGPATSRALRSIPQTPPLNIFGADMGNGEALAHYMLEHYIKWHRDCDTKPPLLFLVGEQRRDIIPRILMNPDLPVGRRILVDELVVYGTGVMESFEQDFTEQLVTTSVAPVRWVVVFSPTGCEAMLRSLGILDLETMKARQDGTFLKGKTFIATIGPTTRDFLKDEFGYEPDVCAEKPSPEGVEAGILSFMANRS